MKTCTLLLLRREDSVLLAMKKRGFGQGYWNGAGGKVQDGETIEQALVRECEEEINVTPTAYHKVAELDFTFPDGVADMYVHTFVCTKWKGEPSESEEMAPRWFKLAGVPFDSMWQDDPHWMPLVFAGKKVAGRFTFDGENRMLTYQVEEVRQFA
jgi:mutator protein MutT